MSHHDNNKHSQRFMNENRMLSVLHIEDEYLSTKEIYVWHEAFPTLPFPCSSDSCLKWRSCVLWLVLSARKRSQCLTKVRISGSLLSPKFPTVALQRSKSSGSVHGKEGIGTPGTCAFNIHSMKQLLSFLRWRDLCIKYMVGCASFRSYQFWVK